MGQILSCRNKAVPQAEDLGLPKSYKVLKFVEHCGGDAALLIRRKLGHGRSEVFAAKVLPRGNGFSREGLLRGIRNHCRLNHIHVVRLLGLILTPSHLLIKLQNWNGGEFYDYLLKMHPVSKTQLLSEEEARFFFLQLVYALHHCHERRVAHRDMKFANIVFDGKKTPILKVCEFGLSKSWDAAEDCKSFTKVGTPLYMPPEIMKIDEGCEHEPYDPRKSDIWSLGVILFTMLLGRFPFLQADCNGVSQGQLIAGCSADFGALLNRIERAHRQRPERLKSEIWSSPDLSEDCKNLLEHMLQLDASKRITLTQIIHHRWVCGPLLLEHAQCISSCREEMELPHYDPVTLDLGSSRDDELVELINTSMCPSDGDASLKFWFPPRKDVDHQVPRPPDPSDPSFSALYRNYRSCLAVNY